MDEGNKGIIPIANCHQLDEPNYGRHTHFELGPEARGPLPAVVIVRGAGVAARVALRVQPQRTTLVFLGCSCERRPDAIDSPGTAGGTSAAKSAAAAAAAAAPAPSPTTTATTTTVMIIMIIIAMRSNGNSGSCHRDDDEADKKERKEEKESEPLRESRRYIVSGLAWLTMHREDGFLGQGVSPFASLPAQPPPPPPPPPPRYPSYPSYTS
jgi:hypothetical protein